MALLPLDFGFCGIGARLSLNSVKVDDRDDGDWRCCHGVFVGWRCWVWGSMGVRGVWSGGVIDVDVGNLSLIMTAMIN